MPIYTHLAIAMLLLTPLACAGNTAQVNTVVRFTNGTQQYELIPNAVLVPASSYPGPVRPPLVQSKQNRTPAKTQGKDSSQQPAGAGATDVPDGVIGKIGPMLLIQQGLSGTQQQALSGTGGNASNRRQNLYVRNLDDGSPGIVNGELYVDVQNREDASAVAATYGFTHLRFVPGKPHTALMQTQPGDNFISRIEQARADKRVRRVEVRIITSLPRAY